MMDAGKRVRIWTGLASTFYLIVLIRPITACTVIYYAKGQTILAGGNEDWKNPFTRIWVLPAKDSQYGRIYFGYHDGVFQSGLNDQGLFYDGLASEPLKVTKSLDKIIYQGNLIDKAMAECSTTEEVQALFEQYNLEFMETFMLFFGDKAGNSIIIEGDEVIPKQGRYQIATNLFQSKYRAGEIPCDRYKIAREMFEDSDLMTLDYFRRILAATHQEGKYPTQYSNIYDLTNGLVYIYHFHNYENALTIDLREILERGEHSLDLASLFPRTYAAERYRSEVLADLDRTLKSKKMIHVDTQTYAPLVGQYQIKHPELALTIKVDITQEGDRLYCEITDIGKAEIWPEAEGRFFSRNPYEILGLTFEKDSQGRVNRVILERWGTTYAAKRI